jgi:hypothetical protein
MSIDKSTMKIFFEAMEGTMLGSGYSSKIVTTPMGPFKWNSTTELWENVNNGMVMNNISFQDMILMDYDTNGGGYDMIQIPDFKPVLSGSFGNLIGMTAASITRWASVSGPQQNLLNGSFITVNNVRPFINVVATSTRTETLNNGFNISTIFYSKNGAAATSGVGGITVGNGDTIRIGARTPNSSEGSGATGFIRLLNVSDNLTELASITWSYRYPLSVGG